MHNNCFLATTIPKKIKFSGALAQCDERRQNFEVFNIEKSCKLLNFLWWKFATSEKNIYAWTFSGEHCLFIVFADLVFFNVKSTAIPARWKIYGWRRAFTCLKESLFKMFYWVSIKQTHKCAVLRTWVKKNKNYGSRSQSND